MEQFVYLDTGEHMEESVCFFLPQQHLSKHLASSAGSSTPRGTAVDFASVSVPRDLEDGHRAALLFLIFMICTFQSYGKWLKQGPFVMGNDFSLVPPSLGSINEPQRKECADLLSQNIARVGPLPATKMWKWVLTQAPGPTPGLLSEL